MNLPGIRHAKIIVMPFLRFAYSVIVRIAKIIGFFVLSGLLISSFANAAQCVRANANGRLILDDVSVDSCTGFVVMTGEEYLSTPTLQTLFAYPTEAQAIEMFTFGISIPLTLYLVSLGAGKLLSIIK